MGPGNVSIVNSTSRTVTAVSTDIPHPNAVCVDRVNGLLYYVSDNNNGGLYCQEYGVNAVCPGTGGVVVPGLYYPTGCAVGKH
jgi:hypothetical protein